MLRLALILLADGTFKTASILFEQVCVILALRGGPEPLREGHLLPSLFVSFTNTTQDIYMKMREPIQQLCSLAQPTHMLIRTSPGCGAHPGVRDFREKCRKGA